MTKFYNLMVLKIFISLLTISHFSSCALLFGTVKPTEEKSSTYSLLNLAKLNPKEWTQLSSQSQLTDETSSSEESDISFQSRQTGDIISINSACRAHRKKAPELKDLTDELLLGFTDTEERIQKEIQISGKTPALETTLEGLLNQKKTRVHTIVAIKNPCVYDLMFISKPTTYKRNEAVFKQFVESFQIQN